MITQNTIIALTATVTIIKANRIYKIATVNTAKLHARLQPFSDFDHSASMSLQIRIPPGFMAAKGTLEYIFCDRSALTVQSVLSNPKGIRTQIVLSNNEVCLVTGG